MLKKIKLYFLESCEIVKDSLQNMFDKVTTHKGKRSKFKIFIFFVGIIYLIAQPWNVIRSAIASALTGFFVNNLTNSALDTLSEV